MMPYTYLIPIGHVTSVFIVLVPRPTLFISVSRVSYVPFYKPLFNLMDPTRCGNGLSVGPIIDKVLVVDNLPALSNYNIVWMP